MELLEDRIDLAKTNSREMDHLVSDYLPFLKSELMKIKDYGLEYEDRLSLAMIVFMTCVRQYEKSRGSFLGFVSTCLRNRMIDAGRKQKQLGNVIPLFPEEDVGQSAEESASIAAYGREEEQRNLAEEIDMLDEELADFGIDFASLEENCPKQKRSRLLCFQFANAIVQDEQMREMLLREKRVPQAKLAKQSNRSEKTIEKHRKYIVTVTMILLGDYPGIRAFLPQREEEN